MTTSLERMRRLVTGETPRPPIAALLGFDLTSVEYGEAVIEFTAGPQHANPMGTLHGGVFCDIADAAMGIAYASTLEEGEAFGTVELKINLLRPVWNGHLTARGRVVNAGKTLGLVECDITDDQSRLVARASSTCMVLRGEKANGRSFHAPEVAAPAVTNALWSAGGEGPPSPHHTPAGNSQADPSADTPPSLAGKGVGGLGLPPAWMTPSAG